MLAKPTDEDLITSITTLFVEDKKLTGFKGMPYKLRRGLPRVIKLTYSISFKFDLVP